VDYFKVLYSNEKKTRQMHSTRIRTAVLTLPSYHPGIRLGGVRKQRKTSAGTGCVLAAT
jgi:hypothetical protein